MIENYKCQEIIGQLCNKCTEIRKIQNTILCKLFIIIVTFIITIYIFIFIIDIFSKGQYNTVVKINF